MDKKNLIYFLIFSIVSCRGQIGPGYNFDLFSKTPNQILAKAIEKEDLEKISEILKNGNVNIDFQEPQFGKTLLILAVGNGKLKSTKALLEGGAKVNIRDSSNVDAINEVSKLFLHKKNSYQILELLIKYGANVNSITKGKYSDSINYQVPLCGAVENLSLAKLLLKNGADPNFHNNHSYPVWLNLLSNFERDNIFVAKYIVVEKKMLIPFIIFSGPNGKKLTIYDFLNGADFQKDIQKQKAKDEIINYLYKIDFPKNGAIIESNSIIK